MYQYWGFGLNIISEIEFPELLPCVFEIPDLSIRLGKTPETLTGTDVVQRVSVSMSPSEYLLKLFNIANYFAANGNEITVEFLLDADAKSVRLFLLSNAMAAILHQRNLIPLHASGILYKDGVVLFCGNSGAGKSTLITALQQKGYKVFTDDVCVLQKLPDGSIVVVPSYPMIKLWLDSFEKTGLEMTLEENRIRPQLPKYTTFFHDTFDIIPRQVKQLFVLEYSNLISGVQLQLLNTLQAFTEIQKNTYRPVQMNAMQKRNMHFEMISALTKGLTVYKSQRQTHANTITELVALIESNLL
jgi:hypothetical protein